MGEPMSFIFQGMTNRIESALARVGGLMDPSTLVYAIGGLTVAQFDYQNLTDNLFYQPGDRFWASGLSVGGGLERKIDQNWSVRAEYRYTHFRDVNVSNNFFWPSSSSGAVNLTQANAIQTRFENQMHSAVSASHINLAATE
jgi:opacity protein-like surface antigen